MLIACVTNQESSERQIRLGSELARKLNTTLRVVSVMPAAAAVNGAGLGSRELEYLFDVARQYHAEMNVYFNGDPAAALVRLIQTADEPVEGLITGTPGYQDSSGFITRVQELLPDTTIYMLTASGIMIPLNLKEPSIG